ncbi:MAG: molybdenum ABC transporter ATP-binding protein [Deltaproteobacteria bacterium]|nr:molybdenum ABC transporter ATP-binding protein [Deltaproteobacteria bacterium]MCB9788428.1 molybdenum ABC transporter ATP-binding protein [Deltaproteobacteria bacterium]
MDALSFDLAWTHGAFRLEARATFDAPVTALLGPSGAGKTTLMRLLCGLQTPERGRITLGGTLLYDSQTRAALPAHRRRIGMVFQEPRLWPHLTVRRTITYGGRHHLDAAIALCELEPLLERRPHALSGGERQRVAIARALTAAPRALLLDEPWTGLDEARRDGVIELLTRVGAAMAIPMVVATHDLGTALCMTDRVALLDAGRLVAHGAAHEVLRSPDAARLGRRLGLESVLTAAFEHRDPATHTVRARLGDALLTLPATEGAPGDLLRVGVRPEDVLLALHPLEGLSARNRLAARVVELTELGSQVLVHLEVAGQPLRAEITRDAAEELALGPGTPVHAWIKATALRRHGRASVLSPEPSPLYKAPTPSPATETPR